MSFTRTIALLLASVAGIASAGCSNDAERDASSGDAITNIANTSIKDQVIGNCWLYATVGWVEALHLHATGEKLDLSESYLTFWRWLDVLVGARDAQAAFDAINKGGSWEIASDLVRRYGVMKEKDFVLDAGTFFAPGESGALHAVNVALSTRGSPLLTAFGARDRGAIVRALAALWELPPSVVSELEAAFGASFDRTFDKLAPESIPSTTKVIPPSRLVVRSTDATTLQLTNMPLSDVLFRGRSGWHHLSAPIDASTNRAARRTFERAVQRALHTGLPPLLAWKVQFNALTSTGRFEAAGLRADARTAGHLSLIYDYEARDVPGFGTLPAGRTETRLQALDAALDERASVSFFRIKNSWGLMPALPQEIVGRLLPDTPPYGDYDIEAEYLYFWKTEWATTVVLPPGF